MTRKEQIEAAETRAAHRAIDVFMETLREELAKLGCETVMDVLGETEHIHHALITGDRPGIIKYTFQFDGSPRAVDTVTATIEAISPEVPWIHSGGVT